MAVAVSEGGPRARYREQTRGEIKEIALRQLAEGGISSVALTRIAKELGLSGPALYRYFASRDDLLNALIRDAYDDAAQDIHAAADGAAGQSPRARLRSLAGAYRAWAVAHPHRYLLIAGTPLPDYTAPADTVQRARAVLGPFLAVFTHGEPTSAVLPLVQELRDWARNEPEIAAWVAEWVAESRKPSDGDADAEGTAGARMPASALTSTRTTPDTLWPGPSWRGLACTARSAWRSRASSPVWATLRAPCSRPTSTPSPTPSGSHDHSRSASRTPLRQGAAGLLGLLQHLTRRERRASGWPGQLRRPAHASSPRASTRGINPTPSPTLPRPGRRLVVHLRPAQHPKGIWQRRPRRRVRGPGAPEREELPESPGGWSA